MLVLGIESSCDETGAALISDRDGLLADALHTQIDMHRAYGGVVPELASRDHIRRAVALVDDVLEKAGKTRADIDAVAVTEGPGLAGALLVGNAVAHAIGWALDIPVLGVHHLEGHLLAARLSDPAPEFPFLALLVSGGHTQILKVERFGHYELLGETLDDAAYGHDAKHLRREIHATLKQAEYDYGRMQYNTVVSACMKMFNTVESFKAYETDDGARALRESVSILLRTLYPIAPHITTALWDELGFAEASGDLIDAPWPVVSEAALKADELTLVVQVNGKLRGQITVPAEAAQDEIERAALACPEALKFFEGLTVRKVIVVKKKLVNIVAN